MEGKEEKNVQNSRSAPSNKTIADFFFLSRHTKSFSFSLVTSHDFFCLIHLSSLSSIFVCTGKPKLFCKPFIFCWKQRRRRQNDELNNTLSSIHSRVKTTCKNNEMGDKKLCLSPNRKREEQKNLLQHSFIGRICDTCYRRCIGKERERKR